MNNLTLSKFSVFDIPVDKLKNICLHEAGKELNLDFHFIFNLI